MNITIQSSLLQAKLRELEAKLHDLTPVMSRIGKWYAGKVAENFAKESSPDGTKWKPLSAMTMMIGIAAKKGFKKSGGLNAKGKNYIQRKRLLFGSGDLLASIHHQTDTDSVTIGTKGIKYAAIHQFGGVILPKRYKTLFIPGYGAIKKAIIPARPYLGVNQGGGITLTDEHVADVMKIIADEIGRVITA